MRRRLYFLLPNVERAHQALEELLLARIDASHIHALAREGTVLGDLPEATFLQKSDTMHGIRLGLLLAGAAGALAGLVALLFPPPPASPCNSVWYSPRVSWAPSWAGGVRA